MMSPGVNGGRCENHYTGTVPKVKCHNHNIDVVRHNAPRGGVMHHPNAATSGLSTTSIPPSLNFGHGHSSIPSMMSLSSSFLRRDLGFSHMNNNLATAMDGQQVTDVTTTTPQMQQQQQQQQTSNVNQQQGPPHMSRIRKESNTSATYDNTCDQGSNVNTAGGGGMNVAVPVVDGCNSNQFYDVPLLNSNHGGADDDNDGDDDNDEANNQSRWALDQSSSESMAGVSRRHHQKSNNMSEQAQVASRLHQIRDYIGQTTSVMERLQAAGTPHHMELWVRLHTMLDGLRESEIKLSAILDSFNKLQALEEKLDNDEDNDSSPEDEDEDDLAEPTGDSVPKTTDAVTRRNELKVKVEESQRKLTELREQQAALLSLKQKAQQQLKEARAAQGALFAVQQEQSQDDGSTSNTNTSAAALQDCKQLEDRLQSLHQFYELAQLVGGGINSNSIGEGGDSAAGEVLQLQNKLEELQTKKMQIDQMVARFDTSASSSSNSFPVYQPSVTSINSNNESLVIGSNCNSISNDIMNNYNHHNGSDAVGGGGRVFIPQQHQTTEDKMAELATLKEQLARMQAAINNMSKSKLTSSHHQQQTQSNTPFTNNGTVALLQELSSDGLLNGNQDVKEELTNAFIRSSSSSCSSSVLNFKQDNRSQAIVQNHHLNQSQPVQQHHLMNSVSIVSPSCGSIADCNDGDNAITPTAVTVTMQQLHAKSLKLQEAKAKLVHLQELLSLVEEFREAGKPVPDKILQLLNSPNGPLSGDSNLDLESHENDEIEPRNQLHLRASSSSSSSSLVSLFQPHNHNNNSSSSVSVVNSKPTCSGVIATEKDAITFQSSNNTRCCEMATTNTTNSHNLYRPPALQPQQPAPHISTSMMIHPNQLTHLPVIAKQKNNATTKLCTNMEEWMKKDDAPVSTNINTDINSPHQQQQQQQQVLASFNGSSGNSFPIYQQGITGLAVTSGSLWDHSPDYSSDEEGVRSEDDLENDEYISCAKKVPTSRPRPVITGNEAAVISNATTAAERGLSTTAGGSEGVTSTPIHPLASSHLSLPAGSSVLDAPPLPINMSREMSIPMDSHGIGGGGGPPVLTSTSFGGSAVGLGESVGSHHQNINDNSTMINQLPPCNLWRKHSTGSSCSLPAYSATSSRGNGPNVSQTPASACHYCYNSNNNMQQTQDSSGEDNIYVAGNDVSLSTGPSNFHHNNVNDNNMNWIVNQISQLQAQLQHMSNSVTTTNSNKKQQRGLLMTSSTGGGGSLSPIPQYANTNLGCGTMIQQCSPFNCCQQQTQDPPPPHHPSPSRGAGTGGNMNHFYGAGGGDNSCQQQQLLLRSLNQCCQLIWHQQCELATLKDVILGCNANVHPQQEYNRSNNVYSHQPLATLNHIHHQSSPHSHYNGNGITDDYDNSRSNLGQSRLQPLHRNRLTTGVPPSVASPSSPQPQPPPPPLIPLAPPHYFFPSYGNNLNLGFQPFQRSTPVGSFISSPAGTLNNQVAPGNRANNYWDNFRSYSRQNLLSARSKCNEDGRSNSSSGPTMPAPSATADYNALLNETCRSIGSVSAGNDSRGSRQATEMHLPWGATNVITSTSSSAVTSGTPRISNAGDQSRIVGSVSISSLHNQQQVNTQNTNVNMTLLEDVMTHNLPNRKEKLNTFHSQSHPQVFPPADSTCDNNNVRLPGSLNCISSISSHPLPIANPYHQEQQLRRQKQQQQRILPPDGPVCNKQSAGHYYSSSSESVTSKESAGKKPCIAKEAPLQSELQHRNCIVFNDQQQQSDIVVNMHQNNYQNNGLSYSTPNNSVTNSNSANNTSRSLRLWNCNNGGTASILDSDGAGDCVTRVELNTMINNRQIGQQLSGGGTVDTQPPRNSNCKRRLLMSSASSTSTTNNNHNSSNSQMTNLFNNNNNTSSNKYNSSSSSIGTESNGLLLDSLEESMYSEVAALISLNEQWPSYLLQLFKDLKLLKSDRDRQAALLTIHNLAECSVNANAANSIGVIPTELMSSQSPQHHNVVEDEQQNAGNVSLMDMAKNVTLAQVGLHVQHEHLTEHNLKAMSMGGGNADGNGDHDGTDNDERHHHLTLSKKNQHQQPKQPRNVTRRLRCAKGDSSPTLASSSVLPTNCRKLDWEVRSVLVDMLPFLKSHLFDMCTLSLLESIRSLVLELVPSPQNVSGQLDALLEDALFKFQGCRLRDICDELISVVANVLISELTFLRLTTCVNTSAVPKADISSSKLVQRGGDSSFCPVEDEEDKNEEDETVFRVKQVEHDHCNQSQEEGAIGGMDHDRNMVTHRDNVCHQSSKPQTLTEAHSMLVKNVYQPTTDHHHYSSLTPVEIGNCSLKSDPVVSDAELAEADQLAGRHSTMTGDENLVHPPTIANSNVIVESQRPSAITPIDRTFTVSEVGAYKEVKHGNSETVHEIILSSPPPPSAKMIGTDTIFVPGNNASRMGMVYDNSHVLQSCVESNQHVNKPHSTSTNNMHNVCAVDGVWAVEQDREHVDVPNGYMSINNNSASYTNSNSLSGCSSRSETANGSVIIHEQHSCNNHCHASNNTSAEEVTSNSSCNNSDGNTTSSRVASV